MLQKTGRQFTQCCKLGQHYLKARLLKRGFVNSRAPKSFGIVLFGRATCATQIPCCTPPSTVSIIPLERSILGSFGDWAKAPTKSLTRRDRSPSRHRS